jgi:hypothetical protein
MPQEAKFLHALFMKAKRNGKTKFTRGQLKDVAKKIDYNHSWIKFDTFLSHLNISGHLLHAGRGSAVLYCDMLRKDSPYFSYISCPFLNAVPHPPSHLPSPATLLPPPPPPATLLPPPSPTLLPPPPTLLLPPLPLPSSSPSSPPFILPAPAYFRSSPSSSSPTSSCRPTPSTKDIFCHYLNEMGKAENRDIFAKFELKDLYDDFKTDQDFPLHHFIQDLVDSGFLIYKGNGTYMLI